MAAVKLPHGTAASLILSDQLREPVSRAASVCFGTSGKGAAVRVRVDSGQQSAGVLGEEITYPPSRPPSASSLLFITPLLWKFGVGIYAYSILRLNKECGY